MLYEGWNEHAKKLAQAFLLLFFSVGIFPLHTAVNPFEREMVRFYLFQVCGSRETGDRFNHVILIYAHIKLWRQILYFVNFLRSGHLGWMKTHLTNVYVWYYRKKLEFLFTKIRCILWRGVSKALDLYPTSSVTQHLVTENRGKSAKGRWSKKIVYLLEPLWNLRHLWAESLNIQEGIQLERCKSVFELMVAVSFWKKCFKWKRFVYVLYTRKRNNLTLI